MDTPLFDIDPQANYHAATGLSVCEEILVVPDDAKNIDMSKEPSDITRLASGTTLNITNILRNTFGFSVKLLAAVDHVEKGIGRGFISRRMDQMNIDWHPLPILDGSHTAVIVRRDGAMHKIFSDKRPLLKEMVQEVGNQIRLSNPAVIIASGVMPGEVNMIREMFTTKPRAIRVLNPRVQLIRDTDKFQQLLENTDLLILNHEELGHCLGKEITCEGICLDDIKPIHDRGVSTIILTCNLQGAIISQPTREIWHHQPVVAAKQVVDPTGAGDSFTAGVAAAILHQKPYPELMLWGAVMASINVGKWGGANCPSLDEFTEVVDHNR